MALGDAGGRLKNLHPTKEKLEKPIPRKGLVEWAP